MIIYLFIKIFFQKQDLILLFMKFLWNYHAALKSD